MHDIDRPDVNGTKPKMQAIAERVQAECAGLVPYLVVRADDNLLSTVTLKGSFDDRGDWPGGIFQNSRGFILAIQAMNGKRYYDPTDPSVTVETTLCLRDTGKALRKYTGSVDKVVAKIKSWLVNIRETP